MYSDLIDVVSSIVNKYGVSILSDPKFWNILSDSYNFASKYSLRDAYKKCISEGHVNQLIKLQGKRRETIKQIGYIIKKYRKIASYKDDYVSVLFSVAIALNTCTKSDYVDVLKGAKATSSHQVSKSQFFRSLQSICIVIFSKYPRFIWLGLIAVCIGTLMYGLYIFSGWWMFFVLFFIGVIQISYCGYVIIAIDNSKDTTTQGAIASIGLPFAVAFLVNALASFFFQSDDFRWKIYNYFGDWHSSTSAELSEIGWQNMYSFTHRTVESPGFMSFLLGIFLLALFAGCSYGICNNVNPKPRLKVKYGLFSLALIIMIESGIFIYPSIKRSVQERQFMSNEKNINEQMTTQREYNDSIKSSRASLSKELSFKGIKLGISWDTALGYAQSIVDSDSSSNLIRESVNDKFFYTYFREEDNIIETLTQAYVSRESKEDDDVDWFTGKLLDFSTTLDNQSVSISVFGVDNKVYAITIIPSGSSSYGSFENYDELIDLYTQKYGEPELLRDRSYYEDHHYSDNTVYAWTFKSGAIRLTNKYIAYVPLSFFTLADEKALKKKLEKEEEERRQEYLKFQKDSLERAKREADSLLHLQNHQNAINEI